jgi:AraC-like DNA-binding protein
MPEPTDPLSAVRSFRFGEDFQQPGARYLPNAIRLEVWFALSGTAAVTIDGETIQFQAGHGIIVQTPSLYVYEATGSTLHHLAWCQTEPLPGIVFPDATRRLFRISPTMTMLVDLGLIAERRPEPVRDALELHIGRALLVEVLAHLENGGEALESQTAAARLRRVIAARPRHDWTLRSMAQAIGMSSRTLNRNLALEGSPSASELLWRARVRRAAELLIRSRTSCADIADLCGFPSAAHFSRRVRNSSGMTPIQIRNWAVSASLADRADFYRSIETGFGEAISRV